MRALLQRVTSARVSVAGAEIASIGLGLVALVGVTHSDTESHAQRLAPRIWGLRVFADEAGKMNLSCSDVGGSVLVVSQFTLYADTRRGRRPGWSDAAPPEQAEPLIEALATALEALGAPTATGHFRARMEVALVNDGPVTILLET